MKYSNTFYFYWILQLFFEACGVDGIHPGSATLPSAGISSGKEIRCPDVVLEDFRKMATLDVGLPRSDRCIRMQLPNGTTTLRREYANATLLARYQAQGEYLTMRWHLLDVSETLPVAEVLAEPDEGFISSYAQRYLPVFAFHEMEVSPTRSDAAFNDLVRKELEGTPVDDLEKEALAVHGRQPSNVLLFSNGTKAVYKQLSKADVSKETAAYILDREVLQSNLVPTVVPVDTGIISQFEPGFVTDVSLSEAFWHTGKFLQVTDSVGADWFDLVSFTADSAEGWALGLLDLLTGNQDRPWNRNALIQKNRIWAIDHEYTDFGSSIPQSYYYIRNLNRSAPPSIVENIKTWDVIGSIQSRRPPYINEEEFQKLSRIKTLIENSALSDATSGPYYVDRNVCLFFQRIRAVVAKELLPTQAENDMFKATCLRWRWPEVKLSC